MPDALSRAQTILHELGMKYYGDAPPALTLEALYLPSCGLMGDKRIYGYAWNICGIVNMEAPPARHLLREAASRLTTEVRADDGTPFVRVFAEVMHDPSL
jgi:hypothetical protein